MLKPRNIKTLFALSMAMVIFLACATTGGNSPQPEISETDTATPEAQSADTTLDNTQTATATASPQPISPPASFGPNKEDFPKGYNPLTGLPVEDPLMFAYPAMLISVSHFPAVARPQAGLSFAPWVFEFYITEGATRFLATYYGKFPEVEIPINGNCEVRKDPFKQTSNTLLGNQVWLDQNADGRQQAYEPGVGGVCIDLYDEAGTLVDSTTTDTNGYYGFNVTPGKYSLQFTLPAWLKFTSQNVGDENADSDADQTSGRADADVSSTLLFLDAGLIPVPELLPTPDPTLKPIKAEVGPIRSGRLLYADIANFFPSSCLVYASASAEVLAEIPKCAFVAHEDAGGGSMIPIERFDAVAEDNMKHRPGGFNYSSNLFTEEVPSGGVPANQINVFVANLNQSGWTYDPIYGSWLRFVDNADKNAPGVLHADTDRLTGRQLHFENFIVIFAEHDVISPTNLDIHLEQGDEGYAFLFRDGMKYDIRWSTKASEYEVKTGQRRPMSFINPDGSPAQLKPGTSWIFVATPYSVISDEGNGVWKVRYYAPDGSAQ